MPESAAAQECPTHGVCPPCREGWGHYTAGRGYAPTVESERVRSAYDFGEWRTGFAPYDWSGVTDGT